MTEIEPMDPTQLEEVEKEVAPVVGTKVDSIEIELPNGKTVQLGAPKHSVKLLVAQICAEVAENQQPSPLTLVYAQTCMYVRSIDGSMIARPTNKPELQHLMNELGDEGVDVLMVAVSKFWPQVTSADLKVIKKNLR